ncbi:MAG: hypothetical protein U0992_11280 [Planctomycetaceae bacterium]
MTSIARRRIVWRAVAIVSLVLAAAGLATSQEAPPNPLSNLLNQMSATR